MKGTEKTIIVHSHNVSLDEDYVKWIYDIKKRFRSAQIKTAVKVNSEQLLFNWQLGRDLVVRRAEEKWGNGIVEQVSLDLQNEFPNTKGFSTSNLWNMKKWYLFYSKDSEKVQQLVGLFKDSPSFNVIKMHQVGTEIQEGEILQQVVAEFGEDTKVHQVGGVLQFPFLFAYVPWRHHVEIITKCKTLEEAFFYIQKTIEEGLSRSALQNYLKANLFKQKENAITNYSKSITTKQAQLLNEITKDNYDFGFVSLPADYDENLLETALEEKISRFLIELGTGFAFMGREREIIIAGKTRRIDMLFYHTKLHCYIVVELKVVPFEPEFVGKLNFYVNAVDNLIKDNIDNPTIGLLICKSKNSTEVKWAFQGLNTPMGVASYDNIKIKEIEKQLPTTKQIQKSIELAEKELELQKDIHK